jgi:hypothetical protein
MGWFYEERPGHEGYIAAFVEREPGSALWRELSYPVQEESSDVRRIAAACACGWRSPHVLAPRGTEWSPFAVWLPAECKAKYEDGARILWRRHVEDCGSARVDPASLTALIERSSDVPWGSP